MSENKIVFVVECWENTLANYRGTVECDSELLYDDSTEFETLQEAVSYARGEATKDKINVMTKTRYGNGRVIYNSYEVLAFREDGDEPREMVSYDGEVSDWMQYESFDSLESHPRVRKAYNLATAAYAKFLDYEDNGMGCLTFSEALDAELGEDWDELDYIKLQLR